MTRYRLPTALGGVEAESVGVHGYEAGFDFDGVDKRVWLPLSCLTEVKPPLPPEPIGECIVQVGVRFFHHRDDRPGSIGWFDIEGRTWETWNSLCRSDRPHIYQLVEELPEWERELLDDVAEADHVG